MELVLVPDPLAPNGEDAFCRELAKRAPQHGHNVRVERIANFNSPCDAVLINSLQPAALRAAQATGRKTAVRLIDSYEDSEVQRLALSADRLLVPSLHMAKIVQAWGANGSVRQVPYAYDRIKAKQIALVTMRAAQPAFHMVACALLDDSSQRGFETLLSAVARLRLDCHLSIIGEGPARRALEDKARQFVIRDKISFLGSVSHDKTMEYFRASRAYIDPCGREGFPSLALHALSEGCPVIGAKAGAVQELIHHGKNGLLFTPGDAGELSEIIVELCSVRGLSLKLIEEGIQTVGRHSWDATARAAFSALEDLT
ncbi:MAG: hypothetical protein A3J74_02500 [Elusimicrobia bacterium RIFCSPHIGHO2_02_FULL_57_9]|nr:MAG: hypothetical protein A3J74_02500 [Elusimicrobia bacterium RIFCSPHIGHO2_02_FULL_57_9]